MSAALPPPVELVGVPVLVTGGAGFIGSHLVDALLEAGAEVRVLDNLSTGKLANLSRWFPEGTVEASRRAGVIESPVAKVSLRIGDIRDPDTCREACRDVRIVFHQAALGSVPRSMEDPATTVAVNVGGTANVFAAAWRCGVERVVYASSSSVYGDDQRMPRREGQEGRPLSPYAASKQMDEALAETFARCFALSLVGLRYFNVYGPRQDRSGPYAAVIPRFSAASLAGHPPVIYADGEQSRDFTYVSDVVRASLLAAGRRWEAATMCHVATGVATSVNELAAVIRRLTGREAEPRYLPLRPGDVRHSLADTTRARVLLDFVAQVGLAAGLAESCAYYLGAC